MCASSYGLHALLTEHADDAILGIMKITKNIRVRLAEDDWTELRIMAAEENISVTELVSQLLQREAQREVA